MSTNESNDDFNITHQNMIAEGRKTTYNRTKTMMPKSKIKKKQSTTSTRQAINLEGISARVDKVHVDGLVRTKDDIILAQVRELFKAKNFEDVVTYTQRVHARLQALGCFKSIWIYIDISRGPDATPEGVEVTFNVNEMSRLAGEVNTMVGNNEGSLLIGIRTPNLLGRGEKLQLEYSHGSKSTTNFNISATKPFINQSTDSLLTGSIISTSYEFPWSGFKESDKGFLLNLTTNPNGVLTHSWQYEALFRKISPARSASFSVRKDCGPNLKSAFRHVCTLDKRDSHLFPTSGNLLKFSTEVAGLGGNIGFVKNELNVQSNWSPYDFFTLQLGLQAGLLRGINNNKSINIADKFFLGGPLTLRGFDMRGVGPRDRDNALGGDVYWSAALHLYTPLPFISSKNSFSRFFKLHSFVNGGNVSNFTFKSGVDYKENLKIFTENIRSAYGAGIAISLGNTARVELNFIQPLQFIPSDVLRTFQFGIGIQYL